MGHGCTKDLAALLAMACRLARRLFRFALLNPGASDGRTKPGKLRRRTCLDAEGIAVAPADAPTKGDFAPAKIWKAS